MTIEVEIGDTGQIVEFPDGTHIQIIRQALRDFQSKSVSAEQQVATDEDLRRRTGLSPEAARSLGGAFGGQQAAQTSPVLGELAAAAITGTIAEPIAGAAGLAQAINPFAQPGAGAQAVEAVRGALTTDVSPETAQTLRAAAQAIPQPIQQGLQAVGTGVEAVREAALETGGPLLATAVDVAPVAALEALGLGQLRKAGRFKAADIADQEAGIIATGEARQIPVLTTDVAPPETQLGKFVQSISEKLGPLGSGSARRRQQIGRQNAVEELAKEFDVELDSPLAADIVQSLKSKNAKVLADAGEQRNRAVNTLDTFGEVPMDGTVKEIDRQIAKQTRLGAKGNQGLIDNLEATKTSLAGGDFSLVKDIRTEVIDDLKAIRRGEDTRAAASVQQVKSAMDKDMMRFARASDRTAAADWIRSNRKFGEELGKIRETELKRIFNKGDASPEDVVNLLKRGKPSELNRLKNSLTSKGKSSARAAIVRDILDQSGFFAGDINPNKLATALSKTKAQQAVRVFFEGDRLKELEGLRKLLNATKRAQDAGAQVRTGEQLVTAGSLLGVGAGTVANPLLTIGGVGTLSAIAKAYESRPFRNFLLRLRNSKPDSIGEQELLAVGLPAALSALQGARVPPEQTEQTQ